MPVRGIIKSTLQVSRIELTPSDNIPHGIEPANQPPSILPQAIVPVDQPPPTTVHLTYTQLFGFLQQQALTADLKMNCPLSGHPLPSIDLGLDAGVGKQATVYLSLRASEALIEYIRVSQAMEVAH